ncbi:MAG: hypothetical protein RPU64_10470 [Candidatus Sedimenticola sp. (ex Thyasira tokunagai)]
MVGPIPSDKISSQIPDRSQVSDGDKTSKKSTVTETATETAPPATAETAGDTVSLSQAGESLNQISAENSRTSLQDPDQASALAVRVRDQLRDAGSQALEVYGKISAEQATGLLTQAPA